MAEPWITDQGVVRLWNDEDGWGVIDSVRTPGGCWAHFSVVAGAEPIDGAQAHAPDGAYSSALEITLDEG